jgi:hypothetical protein
MWATEIAALGFGLGEIVSSLLLTFLGPLVSTSFSSLC